MDEVSAYPRGEHSGGAEPEIAVALRLRTELGELSFISTVATFGTAVEVTGERAVDRVVLPGGGAHGRSHACLRRWPARLTARVASDTQR
jgi:hypothetical protein